MTPQNTFGELYISDENGSRTIPTFTCGHCSNITVMHAFRERPRNLCLSCGKWVCEGKEICNIQCTPLHRLADDHFETGILTKKWAELVPAIMGGASTIAEGHKLGLILTDL